MDHQFESFVPSAMGDIAEITDQIDHLIQQAKKMEVAARRASEQVLMPRAKAAQARPPQTPVERAEEDLARAREVPFEPRELPLDWARAQVREARASYTLFLRSAQSHGQTLKGVAGVCRILRNSLSHIPNSLPEREGIEISLAAREQSLLADCARLFDWIISQSKAHDLQCLEALAGFRAIPSSPQVRAAKARLVLAKRESALRAARRDGFRGISAGVRRLGPKGPSLVPESLALRTHGGKAKAHAQARARREHGPLGTHGSKGKGAKKAR